MAFETTNVAAQTTAPNPLQTVEGLANVQNSLNQNKLFQAKAIAGRMLEQSTGPDGQPDLGRFSAALQSDPRTAPFAQEALQGVAALRQTGIQNQGLQLGVAKTQYDNLRNVAATAGNTSTATDSNARHAENTKNAALAISKGVSAGIFSPEMAASYLGSGDLTNDIRAATIGGSGGEGAQTALTGKISQVTTPQGIVSTNQNPYLGQHGEVNTSGGNANFIQNQLSKQDLVAPVDAVNPDGSKTRTLLGKYINQDGSTTGTPLPLIDAGPLTNTARAALGSAYGQKQIPEFEAEVASAPQTKALIEQMRTSSDQFQTGPNADFWKKTGELLSEYGVKGFDPGNTATSASEAFTKIIPTLLRQQASLLNMNDTDTGRQIAAAAIPSKDLTPEGIKKVLGILEGNVDAIAAQGEVWANEKKINGEGNYGNFRMEFPKKIPPTIFQSQYMTPKEVQDLQKNWSPAQKSHWNATRQKVLEQGWLPNAQ